MPFPTLCRSESAHVANKPDQAEKPNQHDKRAQAGSAKRHTLLVR